MGIGPIPNRSIVEYAGRVGLTSDESDRFLAIMRMMDGKYRELTAPKEPAPRRDGGG